MYITVIIPKKLPYRLTYSVPLPLCGRILCGVRVGVPSGSVKMTTAVVSHILTEEEASEFELAMRGKVIRDILSVIDVSPVVTEKQLRLWEWIASYYMCSDGEVMSYFLPKELIVKGVVAENEVSYKKNSSLKKERFITLNEDCDTTIFKGRQKELIDFFLDISDSSRKVQYKRLTAAGFTSEHIRKAIKNGVFTDSYELVFSEIESYVKPIANVSDQLDIPLLIKGKGSYEELIRERLERGESVFILVSEEEKYDISECFQDEAVTFLSSTSPVRKYKNYCSMLAFGGQLIVGNKWAVGLPFRDLSLVIVTDEHSGAYKCDTAPRFMARDAALMLAHIHKCKIILESFAPSLESYYNSTIGKYNFIDQSESVDCRITPIDKYSIASRERKVYGNIPQVRYFSKFLLSGMNEVLAENKPVLLFHNRRGYNSFLICKDCGWVLRCKNCNVSMTYHKDKRALVCHYCGDKIEPVTVCGECGSKNLQLKGIGSENIEESIKKQFPLTTVLRLDSDQLSRVESAREVSRQIATGEAKIIVGTWLTIPFTSKKNFGLVGVIDADTLFNVDDFRAEERAFRILSQLASRAEGGEMVIQCSNIRRPVLADVINSDYKSMAERELAVRKQFSYPPYVRITRIYVKDPNEERAMQLAEELAECIKVETGLNVSCPDTPMVDKVRGMYIAYITLKFAKNSSSELLKQKTLRIVERRSNVVIDVDY